MLAGLNFHYDLFVLHLLMKSHFQILNYLQLMLVGWNFHLHLYVVYFQMKTHFHLHFQSSESVCGYLDISII